jgi:hypothetical protein
VAYSLIALNVGDSEKAEIGHFPTLGCCTLTVVDASSGATFVVGRVSSLIEGPYVD